MDNNYKLMIRDFPSEEKPRERLVKYGEPSLSNSELLAIILGKGTKEKNVLELSGEILSQNNLKKLSTQNVVSLSNIKGVGFAKACQIVACFELGRRLASFSEETKPIITCAEDIYKIIHPKLREEKKENFLGVFLDTRKRIIKEETLFIGTLDSSIIHPREILRSAIKESAAALIVVHNHPSGDSSPSNEDIEITKRIINAGEIIGIPLLDHIIIGDNNYVSLRNFKESGNLFS